MNPEPNNINCIDTFCGMCMFATYDENKQQVGCAANVLHQLQQQGKIVTTQEIDGHNCCYLHDIVCIYWRPVEWKIKMGQEESVDSLLHFARREMTLGADMLIYMDKDNTLAQVNATIDGINHMNLKPKKVYFINNQMCKPSQIMPLLTSECHVPWHMELLIIQPENKLRALDSIALKQANRFITVFVAGFVPPVDYLDCIDKALHDKLERFVLLTPVDEINGLAYMRTLHATLHGSQYSSIIEQTQQLCEEQKCPSMIRPVTQIVPSMQTHG